MSPSPGQTLPKDPQDKLTHEFDWSAWLGATALITSSAWTISGGDTGGGAPATVLTYDNAAIVSGSQKTTLRLLAGTVRKKYTVTNHIITNETPPQEKDKSIFIHIGEE